MNSKLFACRCATLLSVVTFVAAVLQSIPAKAHYCGPPVIRCKPGDIITYYILSDVAEEGVSFFGIFDQTNPEVAPVYYYTPTGRVYGMYVIKALEVGTNNLALSWSFPPRGAFDVCLLEVRVTTNQTTTTSGNNPQSAFAGDPVNAFTGELVIKESPDLYLGGPMPLCFSRYYASRLQADAGSNPRLGNNWSHNFEWNAILAITNEAVIVSPEGMKVRFAQSGTNWILQSPAYLPFQLVNIGTNVVFGNPRNNLLYTFSTNGLLQSISDGKGNTHALSYTNELLIQVSDGLGRALTFDYFGAHSLLRVSDGTRSVGFTTFEIGSELNLFRVTNSLGKVTTYSYDNSKEVGSLLTSTTYPLGNQGYSQVYDSHGRVIQQTRLGTNITRFAYSPTGFTTYVTNAMGNITVYSHSPSGQFLGLVDSTGKSLTVSTNTQGKRSGISDRTGGSVGVAYDLASGQPSAITNADGGVTRFTYTNRTVSGITLSELSSVALPNGAAEQFTYDASGNLLAYRDRAGNFARFGYNNRGQIVSATNSAGGITTLVYNPDGTPLSQSDPEMGTVTFGHDSLRRATNALASDGRSIRVTYDLGDRIASITDERTNTSFFAFDNNNRLIAVTNALGQVTRFNYDNASRLVSVSDRLNRSVAYNFDSLDQLVGFTNRNGNRIQFVWDARQRLSALLDAAGKARTFGYDDENLLTSYTNPLGKTISVRRDNAGFVSAITNALGQVTSLTRDLMHRVTSTTDPLGHVDQFKYESRELLTNTVFSALGTATSQFNDQGLLSRLVDQGGSPWLFNYSAFGRLTSSVDPLDRTNSVGYDSRGRPLWLAFADGSSATNTYDASGNLIRMDFSGGLGSTYAFDPLHRLTNSSGISLAYDAEDRITNTVSSGINFGAAFDPGGRLTNATYNNGAFTVSYVYDSRDRLIQVSDNLANAQINFFYDDAGHLTNVVRGNGVNGIYDYNGAGRLSRIREGNFIDLQYTFDAAGRIASLNATAPLSPSSAAPQTNSLAFDAGHQIKTPGYGYDNRGRLVNAPSRNFVWNAASQLVRADVAAIAVTNTYNGAGNVLTRGTPSGITRYHYNHAINRVPIMAEQNASNGQFQRYYVWSPNGQLLYMIDAAAGNVVSYYHFDLTGSTLALTSAGGTVTDAYAYTPFGLAAARTGTNPQPFTYVGRHGVRWDSTASLYHMRARFYDPEMARFISRDPMWPRVADPASLNPYIYVANNPLQYIDPLGTRTETEAALPVQVLGREDVSLRSTEGVGDVLRSLNATVPQPDAAFGSVNLRGLGQNRTLVLINGRRVPGSDGAIMDLNSIPAAEIERVEVLKEGASAIYGSDAVSGVINIIKKKPPTEFDYGNINVGYKFEPKLEVGLNYTVADPPPEPPVPQPVRANCQFTFFQMMPEPMMVAAYGAMIQRAPNGLRITSGARNYLQALLLLSPNPYMLTPRGVAFVNGQFVKPKQIDLLYEMFLREEFLDELWDEGIPPFCIYFDLLSSLQMGGSGGAYADFMGYRAVGIPPLF